MNPQVRAASSATNATASRAAQAPDDGTAAIAELPRGFDAVIDEHGRLASAITDEAVRNTVRDIVSFGEVTDGATARPARVSWLNTVATLARDGGVRLLRAPGNAHDGYLMLVGCAHDRAVGLVLHRERSTDPEVIDAFATCHGLTPAERRILHLLAEGLPPKKIAGLARRSEATVRSQVRSVLGKCQYSSVRDMLLCLASLQICCLRADTGARSPQERAANSPA